MKAKNNECESIYQFSALSISGEEQKLDLYKGKILLIVNTASKCGFTPQYKDLEDLYQKYKDNNFCVLGFPCNQFLNQEPADESEIKNFCQMNYGVSFPLFSKVKVNGEDAHPLFKFLSKKAPGVFGTKAIKWNFTKFLINTSGIPVKRYAPKVSFSKITSDLKNII